MRVDHRLMPVPVRMRLRDRPIMLVLVMLIICMAVFNSSKSCSCSCSCRSAKCINSPKPISAPERTNLTLSESCSRTIATSAPTNGANEKYAP